MSGRPQRRPAPPAGQPGPAGRYQAIRAATEALCAPLSPEDATVQSMDDASPAKWHLAHTTWFFETFILEREVATYEPFHPAFRVLFNSYYETVGRQHPRPRRGLVSRPGLEEIRAYRRHVDARLLEWLDGRGKLDGPAGEVLELGLQHEQQHQELILTDIKHMLSCNPQLHPAYHRPPAATAADPGPLRWHLEEGGARRLGHDGEVFSFDNERPRHEVLVGAFQLASRPITCGEYLEFMADGGYRRPELWLADGWAEARKHEWEAPLYWEKGEHGWSLFTLGGLRPVRVAEPVTHVSYYEADAFARWAGARLPTEAEWEAVAAGREVAGNFVESGRLHPHSAALTADGAPAQLFGDVWEWTASPYVPYPGYRPLAGSLGEYNGKFMVNQMVLRGGSCASPRSHLRATYRNFFYPHMRWQFTGIRLARDGRRP